MMHFKRFSANSA